MKEKYDQIITFLKDYFKETNGFGAVIGISGGKDSTVVAKLLCDAIGSKNVFGVLMPNGKQSDIADAIEVCKLLDINYQEVNIEEMYNTTIRSIQRGIRQRTNSTDIVKYGKPIIGESYFITDKSKTNIVPRIRMTVLYAITQSLGYRVVGTSNKSEQFIGWFTKWGDYACDINPIAHLTCTEVVALGKFLNLPEHLIYKIPADGITGKSDEDNLGISYKTLDNFIQNHFCSSFPHNIQNQHKIYEMYYLSRHKFAPLTIED